MARRIGGNDSPLAALLLAWHSVSIGDYDAGAKQFAKTISVFGSKLSTAELETVYRGSCQAEAQRKSALKILDAHPDNDWTPTLLLQLGEPARSFSAFEHGKSGLSDGYFNWLWGREAWPRKAHQDPSFQNFAKRMGMSMVDYWKQNGWPDLCKPTLAAGPDAFICR